jgi:TMEM175 potassium channel family protein
VSKTRLEAFSDGVIAIIITIMVLEIQAPDAAELGALRGLLPVLLSYLLSFVFIGIYWNNHHHLLQAVNAVNGRILWANLHLLFWLSLIPFVTRWMGATHFAAWPVALYGVVQLCAGSAYFLLTRALVRHHGTGAAITAAVGPDRKGKLSLALYAVAIPIALVAPAAAGALYILVALLWFVPDRRIEQVLSKSPRPTG